MTHFVERYQAGEHEHVWAELLQLGHQIRQEPVWSEAQAVARDTMHRARANIEILVPRLRALGYQFVAEQPNTMFYIPSAFMPPTPVTQARARELEQLVGVFPLSLHAWYEIVGAVNFMGSHPSLPQYFHGAILPDPLVVDPIIDEEFETYAEWREDYDAFGADDMGPFCLEIAPDEYHKADISGGSPYCLEVPNGAIDGMLPGEWHGTTFVNYLRLCFRWGGFPGFERFPIHERPAELLAHLSSDLLPL